MNLILCLCAMISLFGNKLNFQVAELSTNSFYRQKKLAAPDFVWGLHGEIQWAGRQTSIKSLNMSRKLGNPKYRTKLFPPNYWLMLKVWTIESKIYALQTCVLLLERPWCTPKQISIRHILCVIDYSFSLIGLLVWDAKLYKLYTTSFPWNCFGQATSIWLLHLFFIS